METTVTTGEDGSGERARVSARMTEEEQWVDAECGGHRVRVRLYDTGRVASVLMDGIEVWVSDVDAGEGAPYLTGGDIRVSSLTQTGPEHKGQELEVWCWAGRGDCEVEIQNHGAARWVRVRDPDDRVVRVALRQDLGMVHSIHVDGERVWPDGGG